MTTPHLMNCSHSDSGWCLECVKKLYDEAEHLREMWSDASPVLYAVDEFLAGRIDENQLQETVNQGESDE